LANSLLVGQPVFAILWTFFASSPAGLAPNGIGDWRFICVRDFPDTNLRSLPTVAIGCTRYAVPMQFGSSEEMPTKKSTLTLTRNAMTGPVSSPETRIVMVEGAATTWASCSGSQQAPTVAEALTIHIEFRTTAKEAGENRLIGGRDLRPPIHRTSGETQSPGKGEHHGSAGFGEIRKQTISIFFQPNVCEVHLSRAKRWGLN
jgi:hypothetical protein